MLIRRIGDGSIVEINAVDSRLKMASELEISGLKILENNGYRNGTGSFLYKEVLEEKQIALAKGNPARLGQDMLVRANKLFKEAMFAEKWLRA
jgi:hypothetical protein|tara:strand:+ start:95 stop:373 length:279 start_codon:yes stop_codon:yes gene_type:complete